MCQKLAPLNISMGIFPIPPRECNIPNKNSSQVKKNKNFLQLELMEFVVMSSIFAQTERALSVLNKLAAISELDWQDSHGPRGTPVHTHHCT